MFVAIGQMPANNIFESIVKKDEAGHALADENCKTQIEGLFVAGDCRAKKIRQLTTAVADGTTAALLALSYLDKNN